MPALTPRHRALGNVVRERRHAVGLSIEELGEKAGLSANYVGDAERGERNISVRALWQLADGLGTVASSLLGDAERAGQE